MIALLEARSAGLLGRAHWLRNIVAGVVVGVVALPLAMAFAIASGANPEQGIYTAIVASVVVSVFGGREEVVRDLHRRKVRVMVSRDLPHALSVLA